MREPLIHPGPVPGSEGETVADGGEHRPSPWGGLSGALMFYRGSAIGVVVEHHPRQGDSALRAVGFERIATASAEIRQCLGLPPPDSLPCVNEHVTVRVAPASGVPVSEADPRRLGVHAAISVPGVPDEVLPEYVPRDVDVAELGVRARVEAAARRGGFVLLVGWSSVGKTRCAVEAVKAALPDWWLEHPAGQAEVAALAQAPPPRTVVWLDELQRYLDGEHGLTGGTVRALLNAPGPVVIVATLWPDRYAAYTMLPAAGDPDPRAREREVLDLAEVIHISPDFSPAEQDRTHAAAARDPRLAAALEATGYGLTQTLAAAPQFIARWQDARGVNPYAWAVLTAALDATRLGARAPLPADLLRAAAPGYCTSQQQAEAPDGWFEQALAYATTKLHGAAAALSPAGTGTMGQIAGYTAADYLIQHATRERRHARVPASAWDALLSHVRDPDDAVMLAESAEARLLYCYAIPLYRYAANNGYLVAAASLAELLFKREDLDELRARSDGGDVYAATRLDELLALRKDLDELRARADAGHRWAAVELSYVLLDRCDLEELEARADAGDADAAVRLDEWLEQLEVEYPNELRAQADAGDHDAARELSFQLLLRGGLDELRARADAGDADAASRLAQLLFNRGNLGELRARADAGSADAASSLAQLLFNRGDLDELSARADAGDVYADKVLPEHGDLAGAVQVLRARANAGDGDAARLAVLLRYQGQHEEAERLRRFGLAPDGSIAHG